MKTLHNFSWLEGLKVFIIVLLFPIMPFVITKNWRWYLAIPTALLFFVIAAIVSELKIS